MQNCVANWPLILEYLKVLLSWPPLAFLAACIVLPMFRHTIAEKLKQLVEGKGANWHLRFVDPAQSQGTAPATPPTAHPDQLTAISHDPAAARAEILRWWTAATSENILHRIYGTQWRLLERVEGSGAEGVRLDDLRPFYDEHVRLVSGTPNFLIGTWDDYIGFLRVNTLVESAADAAGAVHLKLTPLGHEFLRYIRTAWGNQVAALRF